MKSIKINALLSIIKTLSSILFPLITFPYISRVLLPENVGKVNFGLSFINYFMLIAALGIQTYAIRVCAAKKDDRNELTQISSQLFSINIITTIIAYFFLFVTLIVYPNLDEYRIIILVQSISILFTTLGADWLNSAMEDFKYITIRTLFFQMLSLALMFLFVRRPEDYIRYAIILVFSSSGANAVNVWYRKRYCDTYFTLNIDWKIHVVPILSLFVMSLAQTIFGNADVTMLGLMQNDFQVGLYSTAHKVTLTISQVVQALALVIIPRLSYYFSCKDYETANLLLKKVLSFNLTLGLPIVIGVEMMAEEIIIMIGGPEYIQAVPIIRILILSFMFSLVGGSFLGNAILIPMGKERYYMIVCCITAVANVILNAILIPYFAAVGAAISTAFNGLLILILLLFRVDKNIKIKGIAPLFIKPLIGCFFIVIACSIFSGVSNFAVRVMLSIFTSIFVYGLIQILLKNELVIELIKSLFVRIKRSK